MPTMKHHNLTGREPLSSSMTLRATDLLILPSLQSTIPLAEASSLEYSVTEFLQPATPKQPLQGPAQTKIPTTIPPSLPNDSSCVAATDGGPVAIGKSVACQLKIGKNMLNWAIAIFHHEGGHAQDLNVRNNNPGNLKFVGQQGGHPDKRNFAVFDTMQNGWMALFYQLKRYVVKHPNYTILNIMAFYLGNPDPLHPIVTSEGDPFVYANAVAAQIGVSPVEGTLAQIFGGN